MKLPLSALPALRRQTLLLLGTLILACGTPVQSMAAQDRFADPAKVLRTVFPVAETGFDPAAARDLYSNAIVEAVFERLYGYDYLASPARIIPEAAAALPEISDDGLTYTIRLRKGLHFTPDPAFKGKERELQAKDFIYSLMRLMDPAIASSHRWLLEGKIIGLDELAEKARKTGKFDYDAIVPGLQASDPYTLKIRLHRPDYNLPMILAYTATSAVAREVVEKYCDGQGQVMANPVGSGPYRLTEWVRGSRMVLEANPGYREHYWDSDPGADPEKQKIARQMKGKRIPQIGKVIVQVILEDQSRLLAFQKNETDLFQLYGGLAPQVLQDGKLKPEFASKGVQLSRIISPELTIYYWNMQDPVLGGLSKEKIALRRAIAMAHQVEEEIRIVDNGQAIPLQFPVPPGVVGHDPQYKSSIQYNPAAANALLDRFGYKKGADGYRTLPDGSPLVIRFTSQTESRGHLQAEVWKKTYDRLSIRMETDFRPFSEILKAEKQCQLKQRISPWMADYPDGDNFMQLFYGKNIHLNNNGCVSLPEFDKLYEQSQRLPAGPERDALYHKMARLMEAYSAQRIGFARYFNMLAQPRVIGYQKHPVMHIEWPYLDLDTKR
jgi:ABC-type transport system substrate-binding protein